MKQFQPQVIYNKQISADFFELSLTWDKTAGAPLPGQFLTIRVSRDSVPLLRRPFAFAGFDKAALTTSIIYQKRGRATEILSAKQSGEQLDVIGPLGNSFPVTKGLAEAVAVAGGVGLGPVLFLVNYLKERSIPVTFVFGCRTASLIPDSDAFRAALPRICTDDGSAGFKGNSVSYLENNVKISKESVLYACGPAPMLKSLNNIADLAGARAWVSVEQVMACGVGACMGCAVKVVSGGARACKESTWEYVRACKEGPVFAAKDIVWE